MKKIIAIVFIVSLFISSNAYAGAIELDFSQRKPINAAVRSALMPGWGQHWNEQPVKGWITFGLFAASVFGAFYYNNRASSYFDKYESQGLINGSYFDDYESARNKSQIFTFVAVGTWLYSVIDAYFVCKSQVSGSQKVSSINLFYNPKSDAYYAVYSRKFSFN